MDVQQVGGFEQLTNALKLRYQHTPRVCQQQFTSKRQTAGETPQQLADTLQRMARRSYPAALQELLDPIVGSQFLVALNNDEIRRFVLLSRPTTLYEHVSAAMEAQVLAGFMQSTVSVNQVAENGQGIAYNNNNNNGGLHNKGGIFELV